MGGGGENVLYSGWPAATLASTDQSQEQTHYTDKKHLQTWPKIAWGWRGVWVQRGALLRVTALETQEKQIFVISGCCVT